jgi:hypothetical protein
VPETLSFTAERVGETGILRWEVTPSTLAMPCRLLRQLEGADRQLLNDTVYRGRRAWEVVDHDPPAVACDYWLDITAPAGNHVLFGPARLPALPVAPEILPLSLGRPSPNPSRGVINLVVDLPEPSHLRLALFDVMGRTALVILDEELPSGRHNLSFDLNRSRDGGLAAGLYILKLSSPLGSREQRLVILH